MRKMREVEIFVIGNYDYYNDIGIWTYYLNYQKAVIKRTDILVHAQSANRVTLSSLYFALQHVTEPCIVKIHSKVPLGFGKPRKANNKDMIVKIYNLIKESGHVVIFDTKDDFGRVKIWEQVYGTPVPALKETVEERVEAIKTSQPLLNQKQLTPNDVFSHSQENRNDWHNMYDDLDEPRGWVPGSGGY